MGKGTLQQFPALPQQPSASGTLDPPPVGIYRLSFGVFAGPVSATPLGLTDVAADFNLFKIPHGLVAVIALVGHHFFNGSMHPGRGLGVGLNAVEVVGGPLERLPPRSSVAFIGGLHGHR